MGKKGKRSKRQQAKKVDTDRISIANILNRVKENYDRAEESSLKRLYSDAVSSLRETLQFIEANEAIIVRDVKGTEYESMFYEYLIMQVYSKLIVTEYDARRNYEEVIQIYNSFTSKLNRATVFKVVWSSSYLEDNYITLIMIYHELALIRVSNHVRADSVIFQNATKYMKKTNRDKASNCNARIVSCLRATKNFDAAIDMDRKFRSIRNLDEGEEIESAVSLAITYIERYRVEFHKHTEKENRQEIARVSEFVVDTLPKCNLGALSYNNTELQLSHSVALAQWFYLLSKDSERGDEMWTAFCRQAIECVQMLIADKWHMKDNCFYCHQAPTKDEVKLVCGDCRVACYCSIDHQRASWKKNALHDMCFGHEAICPAMKAYRRWQEAVDGGDMEKEVKMERRLGRECLRFLAYGLGLEDKCFEIYDAEEVESG